MQAPTPDEKLAARGYRIVAYPVLRQGQPVALLPSFRNVHQTQYANLKHAANRTTDGCVQNLAAAGCCGA